MTAPDGLSDRSAALWEAVVADFVLSAVELALLHEGCIALDRAAQAAAVIDAEGVTVKDRCGSPKSHPACDVEARNGSIVAAIIRQLGVSATTERVPRTGAKGGPRTPRRSD